MRSAIEKGDIDRVKQLVADGYPINVPLNEDKKTTCLHLACIRGKADILKYLITERADVNARDNKNWTPLILAASGGDYECVKHLLSEVVRTV